MEWLEKLKAFLVSITAFLVTYPKLILTRSKPPTLPSSTPASADDPETLQPESSPSTINLGYSSQPPTQPSPPRFISDPETLQPQSPPPIPPLSSTFNIELLQPTSATNQPESSQQQQSHPPPPPPTPATPFNLKQLESIIAAQQHLQWKNSVLSFCFSYALAVSLQYAQTDQQANQVNSSVLLSFLVLITFNLILVSLFISPTWTKTSEILDKVAFLVAAAAFCRATAIPLPFELKWTVLALFLPSLLLITTFVTKGGARHVNCSFHRN